MEKQQGAVLVTTLIFLFILTLLVMRSAAFLILQYKMQEAMELQSRVVERAEAGIIQIEQHWQNDDFTLSDSPITLTTSTQLESIDACGNRIFLIQSIARYQNQQVILNVRDRFAKVPRQKDCQPIPSCQRLVWQVQ